MKTISDIKDNVFESYKVYRHNRDADEKQYKARLFAFYKDVQELNKLTDDLENMRGGEYRIDETGELVYSIEVPKNVRELPEIGAYLGREIGYYYSKDGTLEQCCGDFIGIDWNAGSREYFVFDHGTSKPIIESRPYTGDDDTLLKDYVRAKIELYQRERGEFGDVIEVDRYGSYVRHFDQKLSTQGDDPNLDGPTDQELQAIVDKIERQTEEE